eukprot:TRINITY_DN14078_c0_g2_i1.p1 TRINITY_DN14078_c0_g2~~TRINITY_DN14078_c0_g2_i1.p1  ORF type:complete len:1570 (+),score=381.13 TRINITY_DN14078_c0_g2_i1:68-4711(+)
MGNQAAAEAAEAAAAAPGENKVPAAAAAPAAAPAPAPAPAPAAAAPADPLASSPRAEEASRSSSSSSSSGGSSEAPRGGAGPARRSRTRSRSSCRDPACCAPPAPKRPRTECERPGAAPAAVAAAAAAAAAAAVTDSEAAEFARPPSDSALTLAGLLREGELLHAGLGDMLGGLRTLARVQQADSELPNAELVSVRAAVFREFHSVGSRLRVGLAELTRALETAREAHERVSAEAAAAAPARITLDVRHVLMLNPTGGLDGGGRFAASPNGMPVYKADGHGARFLYSGVDGRWWAGGERELEDDFRCASGWIRSARPHFGELPCSGAVEWEWSDGWHWHPLQPGCCFDLTPPSPGVTLDVPYYLCDALVANGMPVWKAEGTGGRYMFSGVDGRWWVGGSDAWEQKFTQARGVLRSARPHLGAAPEAADWQIWDGSWWRPFEAGCRSAPAAPPAPKAPAGSPVVTLDAVYVLCPELSASGLPVWRAEGGDPRAGGRYLYGGPDGRWWIGDEGPRRRGFTCAEGAVRSVNPHRGAPPDAAGQWEYLGPAGEWLPMAAQCSAGRRGPPPPSDVTLDVVYSVSPGKAANGWPVWRAEGSGGRYLFSGTDGRWWVGDHTAERDGFGCGCGDSGAWMRTAEPHLGRPPCAPGLLWQWRDPSVQAGATPPGAAWVGGALWRAHQRGCREGRDDMFELGPAPVLTLDKSFALEPAAAANGMPVWREEGGSRRILYSGTDGRWWVSGQAAADAGFRCAEGRMRSAAPHVGRQPEHPGLHWEVHDCGKWWPFDRGCREGRCAATAPSVISVDATFTLLDGVVANRMPVWRADGEGGGRYLYSGTDGRWWIWGTKARECGWQCADGRMRCAAAHRGRLPHAADGPPWEWLSGTDWEPFPRGCRLGPYVLPDTPAVLALDVPFRISAGGAAAGGMPVWRAAGAGGRRLSSGADGRWWVTRPEGQAEGEMRTVQPHLGRPPHSAALQWERYAVWHGRSEWHPFSGVCRALLAPPPPPVVNLHGNYKQLPGVVANGMPVWKSVRRARRYLYSGADGRWYVSRKALEKGFNKCSKCEMRTAEPHRGAPPHLMPGWQEFDGRGWRAFERGCREVYLIPSSPRQGTPPGRSAGADPAGSPDSRVALYYDPIHQGHAPQSGSARRGCGNDTPAWAEAAWQHLVGEFGGEAGVNVVFRRVRGEAADDAQLGLAHGPEHVQWLCHATSHIQGGFYDADCALYYGPGTPAAARAAVGGILAVTEAVAYGAAPCGLALARPSGRRAMYSAAEADGAGRPPAADGAPRPHGAAGGGIVNGVAAAARWALRQGLRVAVVSWGAAHAGGIQQILAREPGALCVSLHEEPPGRCGSPSDVGCSGTAVNVAWPSAEGACISDDDFCRALDLLVEPVVRSFGPALILVSAGFDAHHDDPQSRGSALTVAGLGWAQGRCAQWARKGASCRVVTVLDSACLPSVAAAACGACCDALRAAAAAAAEGRAPPSQPGVLAPPSRALLRSLLRTCAAPGRPAWLAAEMARCRRVVEAGFPAVGAVSGPAPLRPPAAEQWAP